MMETIINRTSRLTGKVFYKGLVDRKKSSLYISFTIIFENKNRMIFIDRKIMEIILKQDYFLGKDLNTGFFDREVI